MMGFLDAIAGTACVSCGVATRPTRRCRGCHDPICADCHPYGYCWPCCARRDLSSYGHQRYRGNLQ